MLNHDIFTRHSQKSGEQREHGEQPHEYRRIPVPSVKKDSGTRGTENVPSVPLAINDKGTETTASILVVPCVPPVPLKNISELN